MALILGMSLGGVPLALSTSFVTVTARCAVLAVGALPVLRRLGMLP